MEAVKRTLLVVDDTPALRELLVAIVSASFPDLSIETADNGQYAYDKINTRRPDLMYTDVGMPIMSGDVLLEKLLKDIESDKTKKQIPTIVISGNDLNTEKGKRAVELALLMYTPQQLERIKFYVPPVGRDGKPLHYEGFTSLHKPFDNADLVGRTRFILDMLQ